LSIDRFLTFYFDSVAKLLSSIKIEFDSLGNFNISLGKETEKNIDERIAKIDVARNNLMEGIKAIDELKIEAEQNKQQVSDAINKLSELENNKTNLSNEINSLKSIIQSDVETFRKIANIPSSSERKRERYIGFISGVIASLVASGIIYLIIFLL